MSVRISLVNNDAGELHLWKHCFTGEYWLELENTCVQLNIFEAEELTNLLIATSCNIEMDKIMDLVNECNAYRKGKK